jgi:DNA-binding beta-propeller fold protein YncE
MLSFVRSILAFVACAAALTVAPTGVLAQGFPPIGKVLLAVNPITNKVYALDELGNRVTIVDPDGTTRTVEVGTRPQFIAVDPAANRVYVANNDGGLSISILDGATDTPVTASPLPVGSLGPFAIDAARGLVYIVRLTSAARDEVTYFNGTTNNWYSIAALVYQPAAIGLNPITQDILVPGHATGRVAIIDGAYSGEDYPCGHPPEPNTCPNLGTGAQPFSVAVDPVANRAVGMSFNAGSALWFVDIAGGSIANHAIDPGPTPPAPGPRGLGLNTVTHKAYAVFDGKLVVADVAAGTFTVIVDARFAGTTPVGVAVNAATNQVYVAADDGKLTVIDGASNARTPIAIPAGLSSVGVNPVTNKVYVHGGGSGSPTVLDGLAGSAMVPLTTTITPLPGDEGSTDVAITMQASSGFAPNALPIRKVYWQVDGIGAAWQAASGSGSGPWTAQLNGLAPGPHTIRAFAVDGQDAPLNTGPQSAPLVGAIASYTFTVPGAASTTSLAASSATSVSGQAVTFTASVSGNAGTATGTVGFRDGAAAIAGCASVALAGGSAACATSSLGVGSHSITAEYSGSASYAASASAPLTHTVSAAPVAPAIALASSKNPATAGETITFTATLSGSRGAPTGTVAFRDNGTALEGCGAVGLVSGVATCATSSLAIGTHPVAVHYEGNADYTAGTSSTLQQVVDAAPQPQLTLSPGSLAFGGQSMGTTSPPQALVVSNSGSASLTVSEVSVSSAQFVASHGCATLAPGASCTISVVFQPSPAAGALNSQLDVSASLSVASDAPGSPATAALTGTAQKSLATHFYQSILRRTPEAGGREFWEGEAARVAQLGMDVNEAWYALATTFFSSPEYRSFDRSDSEYLADLYRTFFNRQPDASGLAYWNDQLAQGLPREMVLVSMMFSTEFRDFSRAIYGEAAARPEVGVTGDFYRGLLARLPDSAGFDFWVGRFRAAQCAADPGGAVNGEVESISAAFSGGPEYGARARTNAGFVADLYNAFLRRGGDLDGVRFWIEQLDTGARSRDELRQAFIDSPEFQQHVRDMVAEGCP